MIKVILYPVTAKQISSMKAMSDLQPKMKAIQEKYKNDKERLNVELANLYKTEGINPLAGCLPMIIQMPILIAIFYGIRDFKLRGYTIIFVVTEFSCSRSNVYSTDCFSIVDLCTI